MKKKYNYSMEDDFLNKMRGMFWNGDFSNLDSNILEHSPAYAILKMVASDPGNKTYQACLEEEAEKMISQVDEVATLEETWYLRNLIFILDSSVDHDMLDNESKVLLSFLKRVFDEALKRKKDK